MQHLSDHSLRDHQQLIDEILHDRHRTQNAGKTSIIDKLPAEIIHQILSYLSAKDLGRVSQTSRIFAKHGSDDRLWASLINSHLPSPIHDPGPFKSFRRLYLAHLPYWFIPQNRIWFADVEAHGCLILARYDNRRGVIEAYRVIADRGTPKLHLWEANPDVMIQSFDPRVSLWLDDPVLLLKDEEPSNPIAACQMWNPDRRMPMAAEAHYIFSSLMLCTKAFPEERFFSGFKYWPPWLVPSSHNIPRTFTSRDSVLPKCASEASTLGFRIKRWANFRLNVAPTDNEAISNYATIDPELYTPTKEKPYQGIWVGDYSAHGCEFLLIYQFTRPAGVSPTLATEDRNIHEVAAGGDRWNTLRAVKLTGDPNVPRGELSFVALDTGPHGLIRVAEEEPFVGARIVHSFGHVAGIGFRDSKFDHDYSQ